MNTDLKYYCGKNEENEQPVLLGAQVSEVDAMGQLRNVRMIYVGIELSLSDIERQINAQVIGLPAEERVEYVRKLRRMGARGIVYFPQNHHYEPLHEFDMVLPWFDGHLKDSDSIKETLDIELGAEGVLSREMTDIEVISSVPIRHTRRK